MEVEINPPNIKVPNEEVEESSSTNENKNTKQEMTFERITEFLLSNSNIYLKNQQRGESDMTVEEKQEAIRNIYNKGATNFLIRFGKHLQPEHLLYFTQFENDSLESYEIKHLLRSLNKRANDRKKRIRNRRYAALKHMVENESYFSESEMMKRNPLLYEQLIGQYLTEEEKKERDMRFCQNTLVGFLLEGLERDEAESKRKNEELAENDALQEEETDEELEINPHKMSIQIPQAGPSKLLQDKQPSTSLWGEYTKQSVSSAPWGEVVEASSSKERPVPINKINKRSKAHTITAPERELLKEEFITTMYESFLEGKDEEFDYANVDDNEEYDNLDIINQDEEDKYFDSEEPDNIEMDEDTRQDAVKEKSSDQESSEDELDVYMSALNQHPAVNQLSKDIARM